MDVLSDILDKLKLSGGFYYRTKLNGDWGIKVPAYRRVARFHIVLHGECCLILPDQAVSLTLKPGDIVLVPHGQEHILSSSAEMPPILLDDVIQMAEYKAGEYLNYGSGGQETCLVCGHFEFEENPLHPLVSSLPSVLHITEKYCNQVSWVKAMLDYINYETVSRDSGAASIIKRLSEIIFVQAMRVYIKENTQDSVFLAGMRDRHIRQSIEAIHADPARKWTVEQLAKTVGLSRTVYAERFKKLTGVTPLQYITLWRIEVAKELLKDQSMSVAQVAEAVGYVAEEHFQKTFKKWLGATPSHFRKALLQQAS